MTTHKKGFGLISLIVIAAVIALGGGAYYSSKKTGPKKEVAKVESTVIATSTATAATSTASTSVAVSLKLGSSEKGSLRQFLNDGRDLECSIDFSTSTAKGELKTKGTVFFSGNKLRGDFTMEGKAASVGDAHILREGDVVTAWSGVQGAKISLKSFLDAPVTSNNSAQSQVNLDQKVSYKCVAWKKEDAKFILPTGIKVFDLSSIDLGKVKLPAMPVKK